MATKYIITEEQYRWLIQEWTQTQIVKSLKTFLDAHYTRGEQTEITPDGKFNNKKVIGVKSTNNGEDEVATNISPKDLLDRLEYQQQSKMDNKENRRAFLQQLICDWYNDKISDQGMLSKNMAI